MDNNLLTGNIQLGIPYGAWLEQQCSDNKLPERKAYYKKKPNSEKKIHNKDCDKGLCHLICKQALIGAMRCTYIILRKKGRSRDNFYIVCG